MQSLGYSARDRSRCEVSEFQTIQKKQTRKKRCLVNTTFTAGDSIRASKTNAMLYGSNFATFSLVLSVVCH